MTLTTIENPDKLTWQDVALSFAPPVRRTTTARAWLSTLPLPFILVIQAILSWRLSDVTNDDEALYIDTGHAMIAHLLHGTPVPALPGSYLSGAPALYPVVAGMLDDAGGLTLTRAFSLALMLTSTVCVHHISRRLFGNRAGLFSALAFALSGSVIFLGKFATYDAPCLTLVAIATLLAITRPDLRTAPAIGLLLALAAATKYAAAAFIPFVLLLVVLGGLTAGSGHRWRDFLQPVGRAALAGVTCAALLLAGYHFWGASIAQGVRFTTTGRVALQPEPYSTLLRSVAADIAVVAILAAIGTALLVCRRSWRQALLVLTCWGGGLVLQASQIRIHEFVSLDKHTAFSALFLSIPAGLGLEWAFSRRCSVKLLTCALVWVMLVEGVWRSDTQYSWPSSVIKPIDVVEHYDEPGEYLSFDSDTEAYYTKAYPALQFQASSVIYSLFSQGEEQVKAAEETHNYEGFIYQTGNLNANNLRLVKDLQAWLYEDPYYYLAATFRVTPWTTSTWYVWIHFPAGARPVPYNPS